MTEIMVGLDYSLATGVLLRDIARRFGLSRNSGKNDRQPAQAEALETLLPCGAHPLLDPVPVEKSRLVRSLTLVLGALRQMRIEENGGLVSVVDRMLEDHAGKASYCIDHLENGNYDFAATLSESVRELHALLTTLAPATAPLTAQEQSAHRPFKECYEPMPGTRGWIDILKKQENEENSRRGSVGREAKKQRLREEGKEVRGRGNPGKQCAM